MSREERACAYRYLEGLGAPLIYHDAITDAPTTRMMRRGGPALVSFDATDIGRVARSLRSLTNACGRKTFALISGTHRHWLTTTNTR
jgi:hypothetical protein